MKKMIIANWKMNPPSLKEAKSIFLKNKKDASKLRKVDLVVCPPAVYLGELNRLAKGSKVFLGSQNCFSEVAGPEVGKLSPQMLRSSGARYVILGHSNNRQEGETDALINKKIKLALRADLNVILCVGELKRDEEGVFFQFIKEQIINSLKRVSTNYLKNLIIAYEPIWTIGKKSSAFITAKQLQEVVIFIKKVLVEKYNIKNFEDTKIVYGGSVNHKNIEDLADVLVDGFLVGRESLKTDKFNKLMQAVNNF